jgi:copper oxidase (laccase) domain-containing protein
MSSASSIRVVSSPIIPDRQFIHGFPERTGGVSTGPRASLNLGKRWGDSAEAVAENRRRLAVHAGYDPGQLVATRHVHGTNVWRVGEPLPDDAEFDGLVCDRPGPVLGAFAADCIPILFADPVSRICGAAHAGWRGTVAGVAVNVIQRMLESGARADDIRVALGAGLVVDGPRKQHIDLRRAMSAQLEHAGIASDHIDAGPPCTRCEADRFFSYRRDGRDGGVHMGFIGLRAA